MPPGRKLGPHLGRYFRFEPHRAAALGRLAGRLRGTEMAKPGGVSGLLNIHSEVDHVAEDLNMPLSLHVSSHQSEAQPGPLILGDEGRDDRMEWPLARLESIGMCGVEGKEAAAVLEGKAQVARHVERAKAVKVALNQAHAVEVLVDDGQIDGVGLKWFAGSGPVVGSD